MVFLTQSKYVYYLFLSSSLSLQIVAQNGDAYNEILSRHKIILDLTSCGPPRPLDLSTAPTPPTEFTAPTIPSTTDSSSSYDMCAALQSISFGGTVQCNTIQACTAVECDWYGRLEMQVDQCHYPPGIVIIVYDRQNQPVFNSTFNDGSTIVEDHLLPYDLKVTVQQMFPSFISVEVCTVVCLRPYSLYIHFSYSACIMCVFYILVRQSKGNWRAGASQPSRSFERNFLYIYAAVVVRRVSTHARLLTRFFLSEIISKFLHIFTHTRCLSRCADRSSQPENSPPFGGMRCNLR